MRRLLALLVVLLVAAACAAPGGRPASSALGELRRDAEASADAERVGQWLLAELISPGGLPRDAERARHKLDGLAGMGLIASFARGLDDSLHGALDSAPERYLEAVKAARSSEDPRAPFIAWLSAHQAVALRHGAPGLWSRWKAFVDQAVQQPGRIGWRARGELVEWWASEAYDAASPDLEERTAAQYGCVKELAIAGPFGRGAQLDGTRSFAAEAPGPWPARFERDPSRGEPPRVLRTKRHGCFVSGAEPTGDGVFYVQTFLELPADRELLIAVQGALSLWVDDRLVLSRDLREWGVWPRFGAQVLMPAGRHRVLARVADALGAVRVLEPDGRPARPNASLDAAAPYGLSPARATRDPNLLMQFIRNGNVIDPGDDVLRFVTAWLADLEGQADVASLLAEPLTKDPKRATAAMMVLGAQFASSDPIFDPTMARDLIRGLYQAASTRDPRLWQPLLALALWEAEKAGATEGVAQVKPLVAAFPRVPAVLSSLSRLYGELGWSAERAKVAKQLADQFPDNLEGLTAAIDVYDAEGDSAKADALVQRVLMLEPESEVVLARALGRGDYDTALSELSRLAKRRPEHKELVERISDVMIRAGRSTEAFDRLEQALERDRRNVRNRLALADARYAVGQHDALRRALVDAVESSAPTHDLEDALDLVEGSSELEPYRLPALPIIAAYEASGKHMPGTAARVLDYSAVWVHSDGSSRMLEHEIVRIQSAEAISNFAEQKRPEGLVFAVRVIKSGGQILEPEYVPGKPSVTLPHLEVGDYVETEHVMSLAGDGERGLMYLGPHWFFREENVAYARSEFVVISPTAKPLTIETRGTVPEPELKQDGELTVRRWRVDFSPAAPSEPGSAPIQEFLPSVRVGWGITLERRLQSLSDSVAEVTPIDPRITRIAARHAGPASTGRHGRAQKLYRWVLANVQEGEQNDGRKAVTGGNGNRWRAFITLARANGLEVEYAIARNLLAEPPISDISRAELFTQPLLRVQTERGPVWLTVSNKYAPFGYVPAEVRGAPAYLLAGDAPQRLQVPKAGAVDGVAYTAIVTLAATGTAQIALSQRFDGKFAITLRSFFVPLAPDQVPDTLESRLLGRALRGAHLRKHAIRALDDPDSPLSIEMDAEMDGFAQPDGQSLVIQPPFTPRLAQLAALPARQTPLLIGEATHQEVLVRITLPSGARPPELRAPVRVSEGAMSVHVNDHMDGAVLVLERTIDLPAARIQPASYPAFVKFARAADEALSASIRIPLR